MLCRTFIGLIMFLFLTIGIVKLNARDLSVDSENGKIFIDGEETHFISAEIHYFRVPAEQWADRLEKIFKAGIRVISTPIEWAMHEPYDGIFYFSGQSDVEYFITLAHKIGMYVILRCGPYIDADRNFGGLPSWLLFYSQTVNTRWLRSSNLVHDYFSERWLEILFEKLKPLLYLNGGPILMIQIENDVLVERTMQCNVDYLLYLYNFTRERLGPNTPIFAKSENKLENLNCMKLSGIPLVPTVHMTTEPTNFDTMLTTYQTATNYTAPIMIDLIIRPPTSWGGIEQIPVFENINKFLRDAYRRAFSVNYYMFVDGTNFGFSAGDSGDMTLGYITSYDNYAPISVTGEPLQQYYAVKKLIGEYHEENHYDAAKITTEERTVYSIVELEPFGSLLSQQIKTLLALPPIVKLKPHSFRDLNQGSGFILYETRVRFLCKPESILTASSVADRGYVFLRHFFVGYFTRYGREHLTLYSPRVGDPIQILVENTGRVCKGFHMESDIKGIFGPVFLNGIELLSWTMYRYPLNNVDLIFKKTVKCARMRPRKRGPMLYRGQFRGSVRHDMQKDSFLNMQMWTKGLVLLNGYNLGRYWSTVGPQISLYVPGCYLKPYPELNKIIVLELERLPLFNNFTLHFEKSLVFRGASVIEKPSTSVALWDRVLANFQKSDSINLSLNNLIIYFYIASNVFIIF